MTFLDDYSNVSAVDGWLTGSTYGNDYISWIWDPSPAGNYASGFGPQYGGNYLMDGPADGSASVYLITFTWDFSNAPNLVLASPGGTLAVYGGNNVSYIDPLVSGSIDRVLPEPATSALMAGGVLAMAAAWRRRRNGARRDRGIAPRPR